MLNEVLFSMHLRQEKLIQKNTDTYKHTMGITIVDNYKNELLRFEIFILL